MFGYIYVNRKELSEEDRKDYQSYYCGLCQALRKSSGVKGQVLLNYDMTFLIILLSGLYELENKEEEFFCPLHPGKKKIAYINEVTQYASDMNVLLSYHNLLDDWQDEKNYPKHVMSMMLKKDYARISRKYPRQAEAVEAYMRKLNMLEHKRETNLDAIAGLTGEMLGEIFAWKDDIWSEELHCLGFYMGKFIYLMDAYEDLEKDLRKFYPNMLPMGAGCCTKCKTCTCPDAPCRFPDQAFSSMEAYGMLVMQVCQANHLDYYYGPGKIAYTSCYLLK